MQQPNQRRPGCVSARCRSRPHKCAYQSTPSTSSEWATLGNAKPEQRTNATGCPSSGVSGGRRGCSPRPAVGRSGFRPRPARGRTSSTHGRLGSPSGRDAKPATSTGQSVRPARRYQAAATAAAATTEPSSRADETVPGTPSSHACSPRPIAIAEDQSHLLPGVPHRSSSSAATSAAGITAGAAVTTQPHHESQLRCAQRFYPSFDRFE